MRCFSSISLGEGDLDGDLDGDLVGGLGLDEIEGSTIVTLGAVPDFVRRSLGEILFVWGQWGQWGECGEWGEFESDLDLSSDDP